MSNMKIGKNTNFFDWYLGKDTPVRIFADFESKN